MNDVIDDRARQMAEEIHPERDLWPEIAARLQPPARPATAPSQWPLALAAGIAVVALTAAVTWQLAVRSIQPPVAIEDALTSLAEVSSDADLLPGTGLVETRAQLVAVLQANWSRLPVESQHAVAQNLVEIRRSLDAIAVALAQDPDNVSLQKLLHTTYEQELEMLVTLNKAALISPEVEI